MYMFSRYHQVFLLMNIPTEILLLPFLAPALAWSADAHLAGGHWPGTSTDGIRNTASRVILSILATEISVSLSLPLSHRRHLLHRCRPCPLNAFLFATSLNTVSPARRCPREAQRLVRQPSVHITTPLHHQQNPIVSEPFLCKCRNANHTSCSNIAKSAKASPYTRTTTTYSSRALKARAEA